MAANAQTARPQPPSPAHLCTICYTSGTTGMPKGVMLSHENVVASVCSVSLQLGEHRPTARDVLVSFLPLAHMLERCCEVRPLPTSLTTQSSFIHLFCQFIITKSLFMFTVTYIY